MALRIRHWPASRARMTPWADRATVGTVELFPVGITERTWHGAFFTDFGTLINPVEDDLHLDENSLRMSAGVGLSGALRLGRSDSMWPCRSSRKPLIRKKFLGLTLERDFRRGLPQVYAAVMIATIGVVIAASGVFAGTKRSNEAPVIAIVDFQQVTRESKAGASIRRQVNEQHAIYQKEIKGLQDELKTERQYLQGIQKEHAPEDFKKRSGEYQRKAENFQRLVKERKRQLDQMYVNGMRQIESELARILKDIAIEQIDVILNTKQGKAS